MKKVRFVSMKEREIWKNEVTETIEKMKNYTFPDHELIAKNEDFLNRIINNYEIVPLENRL